MSSNAEKASELLKLAGAKIDQSGVRNDVSKTTLQKLLRIIDKHGAANIKTVKLHSNWNEGASPKELPSGYAMVFDLKGAQVVASAFPVDVMYAGTMAYRVDAADLAASGAVLHTTGLSTHQKELVNAVDARVQVNTALPDGFTGIYDAERRGTDGIEHTYYAVTRSVQPALNKPFADALAEYDGKRMAAFVENTRSLRHDVFMAQRKARAEQIATALAAVGVRSVSAEKVLATAIDTPFNTFSDSDDEQTATLFSDVVCLPNVQQGAIVIGESMHLGPLVLRTTDNKAMSAVRTFPSSTGMNAGTWRATEAPARTFASQRSVNNPHTWQGGAAHHPALYANAFRPRDAAFRAAEQAAAFDALELKPLAVKLCAHK